MREGGLLESIESVVADIRFINPFNISFTHNLACDIESLSRNKKITLFRIVQEQTKNIIKYSNAKNVAISIACTSEYIQLVITDDGIGFDTKNTKRGLGLSHIYERTQLENGKVLLDAASGKGCRLEIHIPMEVKNG